MKLKKALAIICALCCLAAAVILPVSAETNHCDELSEFVSSIFLQGITAGNGEGCINGMSVFKMCEYTFYKCFNKKEYSVSDDNYTYAVDYKTFKSALSEFFDLSSSSEKFDSIAKSADYYNSATDKIEWCAGGYGDSYHYEIYGYLQSGNTFTVYGYGADYYDDNKAPSGAVKGKDYITVTRNGETFDLEICDSYKTVIRKNGSVLQFVSSEKITSIPENSKIIKPGDKITSDSETTSSTSSEKTDTSSKKDEGKSEAPTVSENTESNPEEENPEENNDAEVEINADKDSGVLSVDKSAFAPGTVVKAEKITKESEIEKINTALLQKADVKNLTVIELTAEKDGKGVQPEKSVKVCVDIPKGYNPDNIAVFYVSPDRSEAEEVEIEIDTEENMIKMSLSHFSTYVIVEKMSASGSEIDKTEKESGNTALYIIIGAILLVALIAVAVAILVLKSKKPLPEQIVEESEIPFDKE